MQSNRTFLIEGTLEYIGKKKKKYVVFTVLQIDIMSESTLNFENGQIL